MWPSSHHHHHHHTLAMTTTAEITGLHCNEPKTKVSDDSFSWVLNSTKEKNISGNNWIFFSCRKFLFFVIVSWCAGSRMVLDGPIERAMWWITLKLRIIMVKKAHVVWVHLSHKSCYTNFTLDIELSDTFLLMSEIVFGIFFLIFILIHTFDVRST